ncbi:YqgE/AlgH family protein [Luteolibacter sp. AS25]|uniref:YqgE/AlgH family protein n=1 Tax=Luteolibacter sp. AS25 TaxID=3135776 RepID=UPI00398AB449
MPISLSGKLLIADPSLQSSIFRKSVIFISDHSLLEGAFGAIINHPSKKTVGDLVPDLSDSVLGGLQVYIGGPLASDQLTFSSIAWDKKDRLIYLPQISAQAAAATIGISGNRIQATVGYSAWSPGQLENELKQNTWFTRNPSEPLLNTQPDINLWKTVLESISPYHSLLAEAPDDPSLN